MDRTSLAMLRPYRLHTSTGDVYYVRALDVGDARRKLREDGWVPQYIPLYGRRASHQEILLDDRAKEVRF